MNKVGPDEKIIIASFCRYNIYSNQGLYPSFVYSRILPSATIRTAKYKISSNFIITISILKEIWANFACSLCIEISQVVIARFIFIQALLFWRSIWIIKKLYNTQVELEYFVFYGYLWNILYRSWFIWRNTFNYYRQDINDADCPLFIFSLLL